MDVPATEMLFEHTRRLREGHRPRRQGRRDPARSGANTREELLKYGFESAQVDMILRNERQERRKPMREERRNVDVIREKSMGNTARTQNWYDFPVEPTRLEVRSGSDGRDVLESLDHGSEKRLSGPWFQRCWSVWPKEENENLLRGHVLGQAPERLPVIQNRTSSDPMTRIDLETTAHSPYQRVRSWRHDTGSGQAKPALKRVVHATYGDLLGDSGQEMCNPTGFSAVPKSCDSHGDALYYIL